jgi:hypothetical protein
MSAIHKELDELLLRVYQEFGIERDKLMSKTRVHPIPQVKHVLMWHFVKKGLTQSEAAALFGFKGHCNAHHAVCVVNKRESDVLISRIFDQLFNP